MNIDIRQLMINDDLRDIINMCNTDKAMRNQCNTLSFWKPIFTRLGFVLPYIVNNLRDWVKMFQISKALTPFLDNQFIISIGKDIDELAIFAIHTEIKLLDLLFIFPIDYNDIDNLYYFYKYLKTTNLPEYDITSIIYDKMSYYYIYKITCFYYEELEEWYINIHFYNEYIKENEYIHLEMTPNDFNVAIFKLFMFYFSNLEQQNYLEEITNEFL